MELLHFPPGDDVWCAVFIKVPSSQVGQGFSTVSFRGYKLRGFATLTLSLFSAKA